MARVKVTPSALPVRVRTALLLALVPPLMGAGCAPGPAPALRLTPAADSSLRALFAAVDARWNARDAAGLAELHTGDADVWIRGGPRLRGREVIRESFARSFAAAAPSLRHRTLVDDTFLISLGVAGADGRLTIEAPRGDSMVVLQRMTFSAVAVEAAAGWQVRLVRVHREATDASSLQPRRDP